LAQENSESRQLISKPLGSNNMICICWNPQSPRKKCGTVKHLPADKAPGPGGLTGRFYKACWDIIKGDIMMGVSAVWRRDFRNFRLLNTAFITLIPKKEDATQAGDFRPISLIHSFAKLIMKVLANRLAARLDTLVPKNQSAFINGRFIHDNFMLVQQTARFLHSQKQPRIMQKLDITKAFGSVSWTFLIEVLEKLRFERIWRDIVSGMLATSSMQILLNGVSGQSIMHRRGLRQGDLLSPMLFILVMDTLNLLIAKAVEWGLLQPLSSRNLQHWLSVYADDVVLFLRPAESDLQITTDILHLFGEASGLKTNMSKSSISPIQCAQTDLDLIHDHLPCRIEEFPVKYLGLPLSIKKLSKVQLQPLIDRLADLLPGWKADLMNRAGRTIQVQFMLTATIIYHAMAAQLPMEGRKEAKGGHCLVAWTKVTKPKEMGGLGVADLKSLGMALRVRWKWLQRTGPDKPWAFLPFQLGPVLEDLYSMVVVTEIGDGTNTLFWEDRWIAGQRIRDIAPAIVNMVPKKWIKKRTVHKALQNASGSKIFVVRFR
jgi:hypothetical protein